MFAAPAAVLFDLDGTLVHSEPVNVESVVLAVRRHGHELDADERQFVVGHSWNEIHARIVARTGLNVSMDALIAEAVEEKRALVSRDGLPELRGIYGVIFWEPDEDDDPHRQVNVTVFADGEVDRSPCGKARDPACPSGNPRRPG